MCESEKIRRAMLNDHVGKQVTIVLDAIQSNVFKGLLSRKDISGVEGGECWVITSDRGMVPQGYEEMAVPETKIYFQAADLKFVIVPQETEEEALQKIQAEKVAASLVSPAWGETRQ